MFSRFSYKKFLLRARRLRFFMLSSRYNLFSHILGAWPAICLVEASVLPTNTANDISHGWVPQPNGARTLDIVWSCLFTIFLCSWAVLCLNVPAKDDSTRRMMLRKFYLAGMGVAGPEFTLLLAIGQFCSARRSVKEFHASGKKEWTMTQAFFADMGGFLLRSSDCDLFPIDAKQLHYLIANKFVDYPSAHNKREIQDKNKVDGLVRFLTICQTLWFTMNSIARAAQHLTLTTLELTTLAFIFCTFGTTFCWFHKPCDVSRAVILDAKVSIAEIRSFAGEDGRQYYRTPLEFVSRQEWSWSLYWSHWRAILTRMHIPLDSVTIPRNRVQNDNFPILQGWSLFAFFVFTMGYAAIFLTGWNFPFPTSTEVLLWRMATTANMSTIFFVWMTDRATFRVLPTLHGRFSRKEGNNPEHRARQWVGQGRQARVLSNFSSRLLRTATSIRNNSLDKDPALDVPLRALIPVTFFGVTYILARSFILVEDFVSLRSLPLDAFESVDWSYFVPHI